MKFHEIDKYARAFLRLHNTQASGLAARRAAHFAQAGDRESAADWWLIEERILEQRFLLPVHAYGEKPARRQAPNGQRQSLH